MLCFFYVELCLLVVFCLLPVSCVSNVANVSGLSILDCSSRVSLTFIVFFSRENNYGYLLCLTIEINNADSFTVLYRK